MRRMLMEHNSENTEKSCDNCVWKENECYGEAVCDKYKDKDEK